MREMPTQRAPASVSQTNKGEKFKEEVASEADLREKRMLLQPDCRSYGVSEGWVAMLVIDLTVRFDEFNSQAFRIPDPHST